MKKQIIILSLVLSLIALSTIPIARADYTITFSIGLYQLEVTIPDGLYSYYDSKNHPSPTEGQESLFNTYITPASVEPFASSLRTLFPIDDERYINEILKLISTPTFTFEVGNYYQYPIEVLAHRLGDCDLFSFLVASMLISQGIDDMFMVLYVGSGEAGHMNLAVYLPELKYVSSPNYYESTLYPDKKYYVVECTGGGSYKVGEMPSSITETMFPFDDRVFVPVEGYSTETPAYTLQSTFLGEGDYQITLSTSAFGVVQILPITMSGNIDSTKTGEIVSLYYSDDRGVTWNLFTSVETIDGEFSYSWNLMEAGIIEKVYLKASYAGQESNISEVYVITKFTGVILIVAVLLIVVLIATRGGGEDK